MVYPMIKKINWDNREKELYKFIQQKLNNKISDYDCVVPVSGGKIVLGKYMLQKHFKIKSVSNYFRSI